MMNYIFGGLILVAVACGFATGRLESVSNAALNEAGSAVQFVISLAGIMCLWNGLLNIAQKAGITKALSKLLSPVMRFLFRGLDPQGPAAQAITMNVSANILGLGNAATPLGLAAMKELEKLSGGSEAASDYMITFVVLNTASIQLLPTTIAAIRLAAGSSAPLDILPAVWLASMGTLFVGITLAKLLGKGKRNVRSR